MSKLVDEGSDKMDNNQELIKLMQVITQIDENLMETVNSRKKDVISLYAIVDLLVEKGILTEDEINKKRNELRREFE
ncbi:hypothetical protein ABE28_008915 [Peribacillus muralis]|uniref:Uncharacterized protein n=2 Tax=Peribacillus muralis TaxID=264697 RepID=A0A1B3XMK9_9BACI|nr:hypothetical protein ABE28_008915 [Peribacillus muralis]